ncbi:MAG TPA: hypothetical protein VLD18_05800, partial [Verrucomicrobiae bacterium]|nr:hypothetical protein [Verrucomicrobiae bacterium]
KRDSDGVYSALLQKEENEEWLTAKEAATYLASLGIKRHWKVVYRLANEQEIKVSYELPHTVRFAKSSIKSYVVRVRADPEHWAEKRRQERRATSGVREPGRPRGRAAA